MQEVIPKEALIGHAWEVMKSVKLKGYRPRVTPVEAGRWAECDYSNRVLDFSPQLLRCDLVFVNQIILHEVAHALVGPVGHGKLWLKAARLIGYELDAKVPYDYPLARGFKYVLMCENLLHSSLRKEQTYPNGAKTCALCHDAGDKDVPMLWEAL